MAVNRPIDNRSEPTAAAAKDPHRRQFMATLAAAMGMLHMNDGASAGTTQQSPGPIAIRPDTTAITRVRMEMEIEGNVDIAKNPLVSREMDMQLPLVSDAVFDYEEQRGRTGPRRGQTGSSDTRSNVGVIAERFYHQAGSDWRLNKTLTQRRLRTSARRVVVDRRALPETIYCNDEYLTRQEVDLLRCPVSSLMIDALLPAAVTEVGDRHHPDLDSVAETLNLSAAETSDVVLEVTEIAGDRVKFELRGTVVGSAAGVPTEIKTVGKLTFDTQSSLVSWAALALHEKRDIGVCEPGFDLRATVRMVRQSKPRSSRAAGFGSPRVIAPVGRDSRTIARLRSDSLRVSAMMDRRWQSMSDLSGAAVWRMTQNDRSVAQCDLRSLSPLSGGQTWTMQDFISDIRQTLGNQLGDIVDRSQSRSPAGLDVLSVTATGSSGGVPVRWVMLHVVVPPSTASDTESTASAGERLLATFTMDGGQVDEFAGSDDQFIATLQIGDSADDDLLSGEADQPTIPSGLSHSKVRSAGLSPQKQDRRVNSASDVR